MWEQCFLVCLIKVFNVGGGAHGKSPVNWEMNFRLLPQGKWTIFLQLLTQQPTHAPFFLQWEHV